MRTPCFAARDSRIESCEFARIVFAVGQQHQHPAGVLFDVERLDRQSDGAAEIRSMSRQADRQFIQNRRDRLDVVAQRRNQVRLMAVGDQPHPVAPSVP